MIILILISTDKISKFLSSNKNIRKNWDRLKYIIVCPNTKLQKLIDEKFQETEFYNIALLNRWNLVGYVDEAFSLMMTDSNVIHRDLIKSIII